jgi:hypothetical protein
MSGPWIGPESEPWRTALCSYSLKPGEPHCTRDATWHGMKFDGDDVVPMESCDEHKPIVEALCDYVHPYVHPCGIPGSLFQWPENECITEWAEQSEFTQALTVAGVA